MRITFKRKNVRRYVSLSALGTGAIALAGTAEADIIETTLSPPKTVGFDAGFGTAPIKVMLPGGAGFSLSRHVTSSPAPIIFHRYSIALQGNGGLVGAKTTFDLKAFANGQTFGMPFSGGGARVASRHKQTNTFSHTVTSGGGTPFNSTDRYFLFKFPDMSQTLYGWAEVTVSVSNTAGPDLTLSAYAYDNTGAKIAAGAPGTSPVPEPSETLPLALGALVLGAAGVRRWRASKAA